MKKGIMHNVVLLVCALCFQSCGVISTWVHGPGYAWNTKHTLKQTVELIDSTGNKSIVLVPFVHVGSKEDYEKITYFIDGLKSNGYVTFHEGMYIPESLDSAELDLFYRKYRRILGSFHMIKARNISKHDDWIPQSTDMIREYMHLSTENDICTDVSIVEFVEYFEKEYGSEVTLTEYDMTCPLQDLTYNQKILPQSYWPMLKTIQNFRDKRLLEYVLNSDNHKIAVLYGSHHTCTLKFYLLERGYRYKYPKK